MSAVQNPSEEVTAFVPVERFEPVYITLKQCAARVGLSYEKVKLSDEMGNPEFTGT